MSLYLVPAGVTETRLRSVARELASPGDAVVMRPGTGGYLWVGSQPERFGPALDETTGVRVVTSGRLTWSAHEWATAEHLPYEGGLANRLILERYLDRGIEAVAPFNGSAVVTIHDPRSSQTHVWTDQFGYHPCFAYRADQAGDCIFTTFPDALLADPEAETAFDLVSMAEFISAWRATPPHTYFAEVKYVGAATRTTVDAKALVTARATYWRPFEDGFYASITEAAEALAAAIQAAISERTAIAERPVFFLSGGADSRVMLFSASDRARVTCVNIFEHEAAETDIARDLAAIAGCPFVALQRDNDFYPRNLPDIVRRSGGMWSAEDAHYPGFTDRLADLNPDLVMTACTTDWLFKGYGMEKEHVPLLGRSLPFMKYMAKRAKAFLPNIPLPPPPNMAERMDERMAAWFAGCPDTLVSPRDRLLVEDRRIRPACYTVSVSGQIMYRTFPYDTFFADSRIANCYSRIHPDWKLNREVWGKAAARICAEAGDIVDANYGWRVDAGPIEKAIAFAAGWVSRRTKPPAPSIAAAERPPPSGSWPEYGWYAEHSQTLRDLWTSVTAEERELMAVVTGTDHWSRPLESWRHDGNHLFRVLTLLCHWRETAERRKRASLPPMLTPPTQDVSEPAR